MLGNIFNLAYEMLLRVFVNKKTSSYCSLQPLFVINNWNHENLMKFWCIIITFAPKCLFLNFRNELISIFCKYVCKKVDFLTKTIFQCIWNSGLWCNKSLASAIKSMSAVVCSMQWPNNHNSFGSINVTTN